MKTTTDRRPIDFKPFAKEDWYGFSGAERLPDGSEPLMNASTVTIDDQDAMVIIDAHGVGIFWGDHTVSFFEGYALRAVAMLRTEMTSAEIVAMPGAQ